MTNLLQPMNSLTYNSSISFSSIKSFLDHDIALHCLLVKVIVTMKRFFSFSVYFVVIFVPVLERSILERDGQLIPLVKLLLPSDEM